MERKVKTNKLKIKKQDAVVVISGNSKGKTGRVLEINKEKGKAIVEGVNIISKHTKPTKKYPDGGIVKMEAPIYISNLMLIDPKTKQPTRVGRKKINDKLVRIAKKTGEAIDK